jgi:CRP-like cAMP-binding protein
MSIMEASPTKESDLFKGVSQRVLAEIGKVAEEIGFEKDSVIFRTDEEASYIYELAEGVVDIIVLEKAR